MEGYNGRDTSEQLRGIHLRAWQVQELRRRRRRLRRRLYTSTPRCTPPRPCAPRVGGEQIQWDECAAPCLELTQQGGYLLNRESCAERVVLRELC